MPSFKKGILYLALFFIIVWMFILGIFVGRGNAPVKFDTRKFQKRLANIAGEYETEHKSSGETDIQFYEALQKPMPGADNLLDDHNFSAPVPVEPSRTDNEFNAESKESIVKSKKKISLKLSQKSLTKAKYSVLKKKKLAAESSKSASVSKRVSNKGIKGNYTIQIAAFKDVTGAIEKIASLKAKGHSGYKTLGKVQDQIWHRVRVGNFPDTEVARIYLRKLKLDNFNGIIIKQD
jgi:cell division septation protein DedD